MRTCAFSDCGKEFTPKTHNQRYCSDECCRVATNRRIMERYYEKKARRTGGQRECKSITCTTRLNRYNDSDYCASCSAKRSGSDRNSLLSLVGYDISQTA